MSEPTKKFKRVEDDTIMPWGKHKGDAVQDVPASYLLWLDDEMKKSSSRRSPFHNGLLVYINENRDILEKQVREKT